MVFIPMFYYKPAVDVTWVPKFMVLTGLMLACALYFLLFRKHNMPLLQISKTWPVKLWGGFILISMLSLFAAQNLAEGYFDILKNLLMLFFLVMTTAILIRSNNLKPLLTSAILLSLILSAVGLFQYFTFVFRQVDLDVLYKINGLMSHKNIFSSVLYLTTPWLVYSFITGSNTQRLFSGLGFGLVILLLFLMQTRGIWLATAVFLFISVLIVFLLHKQLLAKKTSPLLRRGIWLSAILLISLTIAGITNKYSISHPTRTVALQTEQPTEEVKQKIEPILKRAASIFNTSSPNRVKRIDIWRSTTHMVAEHPWLGVGAGNWKVMIPHYYQPDVNESYYHNWRRPHNDFLWILAEKGIFGLIIYLSFLIFLILKAVRTLRSDSPVNDKLLTILMLAAMAGYMTDASFSFPYERVDLQMMFMLFASVILWKSTSISSSGSEVKKQTRGILVASVIVLSGMLLVGKHMVKAEVYTNYAHADLMNDGWNEVILAIDKGNSPFALLDPANNPLLWYRGNALYRLGKLEEAVQDLEAARASSPYSIPVLQDLGTVFYLQKKYPEAIEILDESIIIYPLNRNALKIKGLALVAMEKYEEALSCFYTCLTDTPDPNLNFLIREAENKLYPQANP
jgi:O-antigen ligase